MERKPRVFQLPRSPDGVNYYMSECIRYMVCSICKNHICVLGDWPGYCKPALPKIPNQLTLNL